MFTPINAFSRQPRQSRFFVSGVKESFSVNDPPVSKHLPIRWAVLSACLLSGAAVADASIALPNGNFTVGMGIRANYQNVQYGSPNGTGNSNDVVLDNTQVYLGASWDKIFKATLNTDYNSTTNAMNLMDGIVQFEPMDTFNVWMGRMLPASDRVNLEGPFFMAGWTYPFVSNYPNIFEGRDNGVQGWGKAMGEKLTYVLGAFHGHDNVVGGANGAGNPLYAWRVSYAFLDPEPDPAYYLSSTYWGAKNVLTLGVSGNYEADGAGIAGHAGNLDIWSADLLAETKLSGGGTPTFEAAYYKYDTGGVADCGTGEPGSVPCPSGENVGGQVQGDAYYGVLSYLFPEQIGYGRIRPFTRYQRYNRDLSGTSKTQYDFGVDYVIHGYSTKLTAQFSKVKDTQMIAPLNNINQFYAGAQMMF